MSVEPFRDDDQCYAAWLAANAHGYVLNIQRFLAHASSAITRCGTCRPLPPRDHANAQAETLRSCRIGAAADRVSMNDVRAPSARLWVS